MVGNTFFFPWEVTLMESLQSHIGTVGEHIAILCTMLGEEVFLILFLGFFYWCYDKEMGKFIGTNLGVALVWNPLLKNIFLRRRPYFDHSSIHCLRPVETDADLFDIQAQGYSFPSGHSTSGAAVYGSTAAYMKKRKITILCAAIFILIGISRVILGVHYPTDVLGGWALGLAVVWIVPFLQKRLPNKKMLYLLLALTGAVGFFYCDSTDYYTSYGIMTGIFAGILFEERFVHFKETRKLSCCVWRILVGVLLFLGIHLLLSGLLSLLPIAEGGLGSHLLRSGEYFVITFVVIGLYPMLFRFAPFRISQSQD